MMKKLIVILLIVFWAWYFYDLWQKKWEVEVAKKQMWVIEENKTENKIEEKKEEIEIIKENTWISEESENKASYSLNNLDSNNFIELDNLTEKVENISDRIEITWKILNENVDKIVVSFKNANSIYPNDKYELKSFKKGDKSFKYNADARWFQNIDYWKNEYLIEAYVWEQISEIELLINIPEEKQEEETKSDTDTQVVLSDDIKYDKKMIWEWEDSLYLWMPVSDTFWEVLTLSDWKVTYSKIENLEIFRDNFNKSELSSDNIWKADWTWYLNKNIDSYVYWNTHREIDYSNKDAWISFYVLRKSSKKYIYEKYYFDFNHSLKWVLKIKEFDITKENIWEEMSELNTKLKDDNENFEIVKVTDSLFKEIIR